jgi:hypothetical protein
VHTAAWAKLPSRRPPLGPVALVKSLIELHGGTLQLESEEGKGTLATIVFPPSAYARIARCIHRRTLSAAQSEPRKLLLRSPRITLTRSPLAGVVRVSSGSPMREKLRAR